MKALASSLLVSSLLALGLGVATVGEANAVVCAKGVYRAGCAGPNGAVVGHRPYGYGATVYRPGVRCHIRPNGVRVCT